MSKTSKPREKGLSAKAGAPKQTETELVEKDLDKVTGGSLSKACVSGQHIKSGTITT